MRATKVLQTCLHDALGSMHALRRRVLLRAVEATIHGRRLTLMDLARAWPDAERVRAPLKALDRLLGNRHLHAGREHIYHAMTHWLVRSKQPVIVIDWSDLKADRSWHLLRAAIPVGGRTLPILDMVFPAGQQGSPKAEKQFLQRLADVLPEGSRPVLVTDAGFRAPWLTGCAVERRLARSKPGVGTGLAACATPPISSPSGCRTSPPSGCRARPCTSWPHKRRVIVD